MLETAFANRADKLQPISTERARGNLDVASPNFGHVEGRACGWITASDSGEALAETSSFVARTPRVKRLLVVDVEGRRQAYQLASRPQYAACKGAKVEDHRVQLRVEMARPALRR
jgi:hypothetical protein